MHILRLTLYLLAVSAESCCLVNMSLCSLGIFLASSFHSSHAAYALQWRKQYAAFSKTAMGQAVFFAGLFFLCYTGLIFKLLNLLFILWWIAPLIILPLLNVANRQVGGLLLTCRGLHI